MSARKLQNPPPYPGPLASDWYTKRGKKTKKALRYLAHREAEHHKVIQDILKP
jgi:hypothetical protein